jgi:hypothetical protein
MPVKSIDVKKIASPVSDGSEMDPAVPAQFCIHDDASANWLVRKIVEARAYAKRCADWCAGEQARAQHDEEFLLYRFGQQLVDHTRKRILENGGRQKSIKLPAGMIGFRQEGAKLLVDDETAVIEWARRNQPALITHIERLSKSALNELVEETGEVPDVGVRIEPARENFYIR